MNTYINSDSGTSHCEDFQKNPKIKEKKKLKKP